MVATTEAGPESRALSGLVVTLLVVAVAGVIPLERRRRKWEQEEEEERQERDRALNELFHGEDLLDDPEPEESDDWVVSMGNDRPMGAVCDEVFAACDNNWSQDSVGWRALRFDNVESPVAVSLRQPRVTRGEHVAARGSEATLIRNARREPVGRRPLLCRSSVVWLAACLMLGAFCFGGAAWFSSAPDRPAARAAVPASAPVTYVTKNIEDVRKGETVVAWDPVTGELGRHEVTNTFERTADHLRVLEFAAEDDGPTQTLETTDEHPFWSVAAGDFVAAGDLRPGDRFISPAGEFSRLVATHRNEHPEGVPVYNFEVADVHNYYVRAHGLRAPPVRVHNAQGYGGGAAKTGSDDLPTLRLDSRTHPELAENIRHAQAAGHPSILTHGGNAATNRTASLKGVPRIRDLSRDEYPFASAREGGPGAWVGHIPPSQQNSQGGILSNFLRRFRIKPGDQYRVVVD